AAIWLPVGVRATNKRIPRAMTSRIVTAASTNVAIHFNRRTITVMPDNFTFQPLFGPSLERLSNTGVNAIVAAAFVFVEGQCHVQTERAERCSVSNPDTCASAYIREIRHDFGGNRSHVEKGNKADIFRQFRADFI